MILKFELKLLDLYVNLAVETKRYMDIVATGVGVADARNSLLAFWDTMPLNEAFKDVTKEEFFEVMNRSRREKKARKLPDLSGIQRFQVLGVPPPPKASNQNRDEVSGRIGDDDDDSDDDDNGDSSLQDLGIC